MKKNKNLKGFTLVEMVVVVALFGMLIAVALAMLQPIQNVYKNASLAADKEAISENLRTYIEDQLQYADRLEVYTNMSLSDGTVDPDDNHIQDQVDAFRKKYYFVPKVESENHGEGHDAVAVTYKRKMPNNKFEDEIYVLRINNPDSMSSLDGSLVNSDVRFGQITIEKYVKGVLQSTSKKTWGGSAGYYDNYAFTFNMQTLTDAGEFKALSDVEKAEDEQLYAKNFAIGMNMYAKNRAKDEEGNAVCRLDSVFLNRTISFRLKNILNSDNVMNDDTVIFEPFNLDDDNVIVLEKRDVPRFTWYDTDYENAEKLSFDLSDEEAGDNDIMFIFTKSPTIEKYVGSTESDE